MPRYSFFLLSTFCVLCFAFPKQLKSQDSNLNSSSVRVIKFPELQELMNKNNDSVYVINFWATWCKPCVEELPYFEKLRENFSDKKVSIILVSLDFKRDVDKRVNPFVAQNKISNKVLLLNEPDYNSWIDKVDSTWGGSIPATLICQGKVKKFYEKEFSTYLELESVVKPFLNK